MKTTFFSFLLIFTNQVLGQDVILPNDKEVIEILKSDIKDKMEQIYKKHPDTYKDTNDFEIKYFPLLVNDSQFGVYTYSKMSSHSPRSIFLYDKNGITIINRENLKNELEKVKNFLENEKFTSVEIKECLDGVVLRLTEDTSNSF